jgi:hypothetical protein
MRPILGWLWQLYCGSIRQLHFRHDFVEKIPMSNPLIDQQTYNPNNLLDAVIKKLGLKNDAALSRMLEVAPPVISKIRHRKLPVGASLLIRMHEVSELSIAELRALMGDQRGKFRISAQQFAPKVAPTKA